MLHIGKCAPKNFKCTLEHVKLEQILLNKCTGTYEGIRTGCASVVNLTMQCVKRLLSAQFGLKVPCDGPRIGVKVKSQPFLLIH